MLNNKKVLFGLFIVALIAYFFVYKYTGLSIQCPIHYMTGLYCPGCGITRMLFAIIKLDFYQAFRYNPLVFILLPFIIFYIFDLIHSKITKKELYTNRVNNNKEYTQKFQKWKEIRIIKY